MKTVLFIASLCERYYYDPFLLACKSNSLQCYVLDPALFASDMIANLTLGDHGELCGFVDVVDLSDGAMKTVRLPIKSIDIAWYIREGPHKPLSKKSTLETRFAQNESRGALRSFLSTLACQWVNRFETLDFISSNKLFQQQVALRSGLMTPQTLLSNDPESVSRFSSEHGGLLLKSIGYSKLDNEGQCLLYSQLLPHQEIIESALAIRRCPIFSQKYVGKRYEHRVMVIGDRVMSCRIDSQASEATKIDWRHYDFEHVEHVQVELPEETKEKLRCFMTTIGLKYGAIDLIETTDGDFVFLEINPSGQWGWIADLAGLAIPQAVAEMLASV